MGESDCAVNTNEIHQHKREHEQRPQKEFHEYVLHSFSTFSLIELTVRNHIVHLICRRSRHDKRGRVCERIKALDEYGQEGAGSRFQSYVRILHKICTEDSSGHPLEEGHEEQPKHDLVATDYSKRHYFCHFFDEEWHASVEG